MPAESKEFRDFFRDSGYTTQALQKRFGTTEIPQLHLLKLYLLGVPLEPSPAESSVALVLDRHSGGDGTAPREFIPERMISLFLKAGSVDSRKTAA